MSNTQSPSLVAHDPSPFEVAVRERSWEWVLELRRRLKVDVLLVDSRPAVVLPSVHGDQAARLTNLLEHEQPSLLSLIATALRERASQSLELGSLHTICVPLIADRAAGGVLLVCRAMPQRQNLNSAKTQLELVASWLAAAIEAHLISPPVFESSGLNRIAPLAQLLGEASKRESDRELIRLFGEAIAVWHDIEVSGYVETTTGAFAKDVTLPGAKRGERPAMIPALGLPDSNDVTRLPQGHLDRFGLPVNNDVYVRRFTGTDGRAWLLVFTGIITAYDVQRISAYVALLDLALSLSTTSFVGRIVTAISKRLAGADAHETVATHALEELRTTLGAAVATLTIELQNGAMLLRVAAPESASDVVGDRGPFRLTLVKRSERHYTTTVSLGRYESLQFTPRDHAAVEAAAAMFDVWAPAVFSGRNSRRERRATGTGFPDVVERSAREALERGSPVAMVVLLVRDGAPLPGSTQRWVAGIRGQLRATDLAGMLGEGEIGLLMRDTAADQAKGIAERLRSVVADEPGHESVLVGVAGRSPGRGTADGIVHDARADAVAAARRRRMSDSPHGVTP